MIDTDFDKFFQQLFHKLISGKQYKATVKLNTIQV